MRYDTSVTSVSWIPSEAVSGLSRPLFDVGFTHYDEPPPDTIGDLDTWRDDDRFRFANHLSAWVEVVDGRIVDAGYDGRLLMGSTTVKVGGIGATFTAASLDTIQHPIERTATSARFVQTTGGRTGLPAPRTVDRPPFVRLLAPLVWTTLELTIHADGRSELEVVGASPFPRHWVYDGDGRLTAKAGVADFKRWFHRTAPKHTPWGDEDSPVRVTAVESALERELSARIMRHGSKPEVRSFAEGAVVTEQGADGDDLLLLLDGVLAVEVDGEPLVEVGPGAILGERAAIEGGRRTATMRALTPGRIAVARTDQVDEYALAEVSLGHRREHAAPG